MQTVPNQKIITRTTKAICDKENLYLKVNLEALKTAMILLKRDCFRVWVYFASQKENYTFPLYKDNVMSFCDIGESSYHKYIKELIDKKYLIPVRENTNHYNFYDFPKCEDMQVKRIDNTNDYFVY